MSAGTIEELQRHFPQVSTAYIIQDVRGSRDTEEMHVQASLKLVVETSCHPHPTVVTNVMSEGF